MRVVIFVSGIALLIADLAAARTITLNIRGQSYTCEVVGTTTSCDVDGATVEFDSGERPRRPAASPGDPARRQTFAQPIAKARPAEQPSTASRSDKPAIIAQAERLYQDAKLKSERVTDIDTMVDRILRDKDRYLLIAQLSGVPWQVVGIIHTMESGGDFSKHLHNGDPLGQRTVSVPRGRPVSGVPPFTWLISAIDAIEYDGLDKDPGAYATAGGTLYWLESFNGFGYRDRSINSPYLWACTQHYDRGLYVSDGVFDANRRPDGCGGAAMLQRMVQRGVFTFSRDEARNAPAATTGSEPESR